MVELIVDEGIEAGDLPDETRIEALLAAVWQAHGNGGEPEVCVRYAGDAAVHALNREWLEVDAPTDVLSFPMQDGPEFTAAEPLGDIILALPYSRREAERLALPVADHATHLLLHAMLHLIGFDHGEEQEQRQMRAAERQLMAGLGLHDPWPQESEDVG